MKKYIFTLALTAALAATAICASAETAEVNYDNEVVPISVTAETDAVTAATVESASAEVDTGIVVTETETVVATTEAGTVTGTEDKGSPDTGVAGVAVAGGAAILAAGVVFIASKRK